MINKIKSFLKKNDSDIEAPKELPGLLYEEANSESENNFDEDIEDSNKIKPQENNISKVINDKEENKEVVKEDIEQKDSSKNDIKEEKKVIMEKDGSMNFIDENVDKLNEEPTNEDSQKSQGVYIEKKELTIEEPKVQLDLEKQKTKTEKTQNEVNKKFRQVQELDKEIKNISDSSNDRVQQNISQKFLKYNSNQFQNHKQVQEMPKSQTELVQEEAKKKINQVNLSQQVYKEFVQEENVQKNEQMPKSQTELVQEEVKEQFKQGKNNQSFFNDFENQIKNKDSPFDNLINQDLVERLKDHHKRKEENEKLTDHFSIVENEVSKKLAHMKILEEEWLIEKKKLELQKKIFIEKEDELFNELECLRSLFSKFNMAKKINKKIHYGQAFLLNKGLKIFTIFQLRDLLKTMDDETFNHHVDFEEERNDFSDWIRYVFEIPELADNIKDTSSREQIQEVFDDL